ncbi:N-acetylneuraminate synthase [Prolixibacteraceae bacterium JC049]|nr:N-acetylneuraminate synthase [Prolixibacteraceae bacterium JC049]
MKTFIIAEIGQAHDGSLGQAHSFIDALKDTGVDAVKFQTHIAEAESSLLEPFRVKFSYQDKTRFDYWKRMEFSAEQWSGLKEHCDEAGLEFMSSPFSIAAVELLEKIGVSRYKIGSGEVENFLILDRIAKTKKNIILSSGLSTYDELEKTINFLKPYGNELSLLQCTTKYPTHASDIGLNNISELKRRFNLPVGLSDHSGTIYPSIAAVALGAEILEFHTIFDKKQFGPDSSSSLEIEQVTELVKGVRFIEEAINNPVLKDVMLQEDVKNIFGKTLALNKDKKKGDTIRIDDLEAKKPAGQGVAASAYEVVIGKKISRDKKKWEFLTDDDVL